MNKQRNTETTLYVCVHVGSRKDRPHRWFRAKSWSLSLKHAPHTRTHTRMCTRAHTHAHTECGSLCCSDPRVCRGSTEGVGVTQGSPGIHWRRSPTKGTLCHTHRQTHTQEPLHPASSAPISSPDLQPRLPCFSLGF